MPVDAEARGVQGAERPPRTERAPRADRAPTHKPTYCPRRERLLRARLDADAADPDLTFAPAINGRSAWLASGAGGRRAARARAAPPPGAAPAAAAEDAECTFAPAVNPMSAALLEGSAAVPADFFRRQRHFRDLQQRRLAALQAQARPPPAAAPAACTGSGARAGYKLGARCKRAAEGRCMRLWRRALR